MMSIQVSIQALGERKIIRHSVYIQVQL